MTDSINKKINAQVDFLNNCLDMPLTKELCVSGYQKDSFCRKKYEIDHKDKVSQYVNCDYPKPDRWGRINQNESPKFYNNYHATLERVKHTSCIERCHQVLNVDCDFGLCDKNNCNEFCEKNNNVFPL